MQVDLKKLVIPEKIRKNLTLFKTTPAEIAEVVQESMSGKLTTIGRGIRRTERYRDGKYLYVAYIADDKGKRVEIWEVIT